MAAEVGIPVGESLAGAPSSKTEPLMVSVSVGDATADGVSCCHPASSGGRSTAAAGNEGVRLPESTDGGGMGAADATTTPPSPVTSPTTEVSPEPTPPRSTWRRRPSQKGKPRLRLVKHATQRATAAAKLAKRATQRAIAAAEKAARRKQKAMEKAARRKRKAEEKAARKKRKAEEKAARKKRKAVDGYVVGRPVGHVVRRRLDVDGERTPPKRINQQPYSSRANLIDNLRYLIALDLAGELTDEPPLSPEQQQPSVAPVSPEQTAELAGTPPPALENPPSIVGRADLLNNLKSLAESQTLSAAAITSTAIVAVNLNLNDGVQISKKKTKKPTMVDKLVMVPYRPKRGAGSATTVDEVLPGAMVVHDGATMAPRWYVPRWTSERLVLGRVPPRMSLVVGLDAARKSVYNELMRWEETLVGADEPDDVPGGPEWDERRREFEVKVDHFMDNVQNIIGDRKFSEWGGSVVTSVVGTFLTQNVMDNMSSNVFMSMASKFPPKNRSNAGQNSDVPLMLTDGHNEQHHFHHLQSTPPPCNGGSESGVAATAGKQRDSDVDTLLSALRSGDISNWDKDHIIKVLSDGFGKSTAEKIRGAKKEIRGGKKEGCFSFLQDTSHWDSLREEACNRGYRKVDGPDMVDWEALMNAPFADVLDCIRDRGQYSLIAFRIVAFLIRVKRDHGSIDLEWLRFIPRAKATRYLFSIDGLGTKSVGCIRLLSLRQRAFPVDTNVARIVTRLGWVPLHPLPLSQEFHLVHNYPVMADIQTYLDPLMCNIPSQKEYELHCQMITFGKAICKKGKPNCGACSFTSDCIYYKSQFGRAVLALPEYSQRYAPKEADMDPATIFDLFLKTSSDEMHQFQIENGQSTERHCCEPVVQIPPTPLYEYPGETNDDEDEDDYGFFDDDDIEDIAREYDMKIDLRSPKPTTDTSQDGATPGREMISINPQAEPTRMQKKFSLRTEYTAYIIPDGHIILHKFDPRLHDDRNPYLLVIRSFDDRNAKVTIMIPSRTANGGMFPLNGTYFQENEIFADHSSSRSPIEINRDVICQLQLQFQTCTVHFGTSIHSVTKDQTMEGLHHFFNEAYICTREFDRRTKSPKPLSVNIHATNVNKDIGKKRSRPNSRLYSEEDSEECCD